ncbi:hypothetical protein M501DRAFT_576472 [Patellaria atrata CBS 101060]|uniref:Zn(2)-C6 fungal-type domain-containing protein n=1 Tax=Patellaria atrata CBS 101060 TaxID=1346257 RepID=A0A9P4SEX2_9PEZI|nr:hypothetical protein M501DRAFT_576472 [Patellaria atrata CBS 101060]
MSESRSHNVTVSSSARILLQASNLMASTSDFNNGHNTPSPTNRSTDENVNVSPISTVLTSNDYVWDTSQVDILEKHVSPTTSAVPSVPSRIPQNPKGEDPIKAPENAQDDNSSKPQDNQLDSAKDVWPKNHENPFITYTRFDRPVFPESKHSVFYDAHEPRPCFQCFVKDLPCNKARPACHRCVRLGEADNCLPRRCTTLREINDGIDIVPEGILERLGSYTDEDWERKLELWRLMRDDYHRKLDQRNWVYPFNDGVKESYFAWSYRIMTRFCEPDSVGLWLEGVRFERLHGVDLTVWDGTL